MNHQQEAGGAAIGGILGLVTRLANVETHLSSGLLIETAVVAAVGAAVGYVVTGVIKWIHQKFKNRGKKKLN